VEEMMVEMHLLTVNSDFNYDPIYALGIVTAFNRFMQGYRPETDIQSIFNGLCQSIESDPYRYRQDAERLESLAKKLPAQDVVGWFQQTVTVPDYSDLQQQVAAMSGNSKFKYSRPFAIGVFTMLEQSDPDLVKDEAKRSEAINHICTALNLPEDKVQKALDLYRSNLEKMAQARVVMEDIMIAEKKRRDERAQAASAVNPPSSNEPSPGEATSGS
jgi:photosystem II biogenesis protein Psp29